MGEGELLVPVGGCDTLRVLRVLQLAAGAELPPEVERDLQPEPGRCSQEGGQGGGNAGGEDPGAGGLGVRVRGGDGVNQALELLAEKNTYELFGQ